MCWCGVCTFQFTLVVAIKGARLEWCQGMPRIACSQKKLEEKHGNRFSLRASRSNQSANNLFRTSTRHHNDEWYISVILSHLLYGDLLQWQQTTNIFPIKKGKGKLQTKRLAKKKKKKKDWLFDSIKYYNHLHIKSQKNWRKYLKHLGQIQS